MIDFAEAIESYATAKPVTAEGEPAPEDWESWIQALFPDYVTYPMTERHVEFWEHAWQIEPDFTPEPFLAVWPRGGGKTTTAEALCVALGTRGKRRYCWYVSETQDKADKNVGNIAVMLESDAIERHYPEHASRALSKYRTSRGWRRERLMTAGGFTVDAIGLDKASRGAKVGEQRPDLIIIDDVDGKEDSLAATAKKIRTITHTILPAGAKPHCAVFVVQNLIIKDGVVTRMADGRADFLTTRKMSGPHPALVGFKYAWKDHADGTRTPVITAGRPTWLGQGIEVCQREIEMIGPTAFRKEMQHEVKEVAEGLVLHKFDRTANVQHWSDEELLIAFSQGKLRPFAGIDFGLWRFAFLLFGIDRARRVHVVDEFFSQRETLAARARHIHGMLLRYGITDLKVYGDPANPTDMLEMNAALERGWMKGEEVVQPRWRTTAAIKEAGSRKTGPDRINDMFERRSLLVRAELGHRHRWNLGMSASHPGTEQVGSRFMWELDSWSFPAPKDGESQDQDPDDDTADGGDMMAALRYGIMSELRGAVFTKPGEKQSRNRDYGLERIAEQVMRQHRVGGFR